MNSENKNQDENKIDEAHLMNMMARGRNAEGVFAEPIKESEPLQEKAFPKERTKTKKNIEVNYKERFLNTHTMSRRGEKSIYIRAEYHKKLSRIVQVIGGDQIPLYAYLDNILEHHFEFFEKVIIDDFNSYNDPIF